MAQCPVCKQPMLSERPHAHAVPLKVQMALDEDAARRMAQHYPAQPSHPINPYRNLESQDLV